MRKTEEKTPRASRNGTRASKKAAADTMKIAVAGYKSIFEEREIEVRPLTLLAGANSAGKSSMLQPLLLLKQTLEETYDPGALLLTGNHIKFTSADQLLSKVSKSERADSFSIRLSYGPEDLMIRFQKHQGKGFDIPEMVYKSLRKESKLIPNMTHEEIEALLPRNMRDGFISSNNSESTRWAIVRNRCFLVLGIKTQSGRAPFGLDDFLAARLTPNLNRTRTDIRDLIHLPGLRGNPERTYPVTAVGWRFPGTFENYTASVIAEWAEQKSDKLEALCEDLRRLNLTSTVTAQRVNDAQVELQVGRLPERPKGRGRIDMVNIADVGFGMSQTLPVIVALHAARPGQIVYIEQPELHLHPSAQLAMAEVLAGAAQRGVRVIAETHSSLILIGVQTLIAEQKLKPELVKLHWFTREDGSTQVTPADFDDAGRFGDWPVDFDDVALKAQSHYLDAAEERLSRH